MRNVECGRSHSALGNRQVGYRDRLDDRLERVAAVSAVDQLKAFVIAHANDRHRRNRPFPVR
jgi:hypothetical protein